MKITMVKKNLPNNEPCHKCVAAIEVLKKRGHYDKIDREVMVEAGNPNSEGAELTRQHGMKRVPFFIVERDDGEVVVYKSVLRMIKELWAPRPAALRG